jgi:hypothetical protein
VSYPRLQALFMGLTMRQPTASELNQQANAIAIASAINKSLAPLDITVETAINDSSLILNLLSDQIQDQAKLMTIVRMEISALSVESITRVKVYGWRRNSDSSTDSSPDSLKQIPSWHQEFILDPPVKYSAKVSQGKPEIQTSLPLPSPNGSQNGNKEMQRQPDGKPFNPSHVRDNQGSAKLSNHYPSQYPNQPANRHSHNTEFQGAIAVNAKSAFIKPNSHQIQLLLVGVAIALLGLGMGICIKLLTAQPADTSTSSTNSQAPTSNPETSPNKPNDDPSSEDNISLAEFQQIQKGMTLAQVQKIIGAPGKLIADSKVGSVTGRVYSWKNSMGSNAIVEFKNDVVVAKAQAGLQ